MTPISGIIITLNEADNVTDCVVSLQRVCDEVIVVDSGSQDDTVALAEAAGARVIHQPYLGDGPQKAFAVPQAAHDWILALDADERLDDDAIAAIQGLALDDPGRPTASGAATSPAATGSAPRASIPIRSPGSTTAPPRAICLKKRTPRCRRPRWSIWMPISATSPTATCRTGSAASTRSPAATPGR